MPRKWKRSFSFTSQHNRVAYFSKILNAELKKIEYLECGVAFSISGARLLVFPLIKRRFLERVAESDGRKRSESVAI
jgi:hypothetical protein